MHNSSSRLARRWYKVPKPSSEVTLHVGALTYHLGIGFQPRNSRYAVTKGLNWLRNLSKYERNSSSRLARRWYKVPKASSEVTIHAGAITWHLGIDFQPRNSRYAVTKGLKWLRDLSKYERNSSSGKARRPYKVPKLSSEVTLYAGAFRCHLDICFQARNNRFAVTKNLNWVRDFSEYGRDISSISIVSSLKTDVKVKSECTSV